MSQYLNSLLLMSGAEVGIVAAIAVVLAAVVGVVCYFLGKKITDKIRNAKIGTAESVVARMKEDAEQECKALKKEAILEAKEQDLKLRNDFEREAKEKRAELQKMEQRLTQKDELLNKKDNNLLKKNEEL